MIIAIDGPAAAGKGTLARRLAAHLGYAYLDTGTLYRAVALALIKHGRDTGDTAAAVAAAEALRSEDLTQSEIRSEAVGEAASRVAAMEEVRRRLRRFQRDFAAHPPGHAKGAVLDGRDIGTVICPDADVKLFVTASDETRARRRLAELEARGETVSFDEVLADMRARDRRDAERDISPLAQAEDAHLLDTTDLDIEGAFRAALGIVESDSRS